MAVNATGVFSGTKHALPIMRRGGGGSIVNISSISGIDLSFQLDLMSNT
jgi:3alpha(or 20beta)-hydroxysteroid dehydrogenase